MVAFKHLARQFDLMAKGCRSLGLDSLEDDFDSCRQDAEKGIVDPEVIVGGIDYDYKSGQDGQASARLLIGALCADLSALATPPAPQPDVTAEVMRQDKDDALAFLSSLHAIHPSYRKSISQVADLIVALHATQLRVAGGAEATFERIKTIVCTSEKSWSYVHTGTLILLLEAIRDELLGKQPDIVDRANTSLRHAEGE